MYVCILFIHHEIIFFAFFHHFFGGGLLGTVNLIVVFLLMEDTNRRPGVSLTEDLSLHLERMFSFRKSIEPES